MSSWVKALIVLALVVPMTAYVAGSLSSSSAREPADRGPVIIKDAPSPTSPDAPTVPEDGPETPRDENEARVVTPQPTAVDDDDDDNEADDRREGDDDDSRTGDDTDDGDGDD